jgi:hypothetical protein
MLKLLACLTAPALLQAADCVALRGSLDLIVRLLTPACVTSAQLSAPAVAHGDDQPETVALPAYAGFGGNEQEELRSPMLASAGNAIASV